MADLSGILLVDKPAGPSSQAVVSRVRRVLGADKAGHTGTLDPFATGLLVVCLGRATKLAGYLTGSDKEYRATAALGVATDTDDSEGKEISRQDASGLTQGAVEAALQAFRGSIRQVPPDFSAVQKDGERMYDRARKGQVVEIEPRDVVVHSLTLESFEPGTVATAVLHLRVSKGTYIRAIARDLGRALGVGGHLTALRRLAAGPMRIEDAVSLEKLDAADVSRLVSASQVALPMPDLRVTPEEADKLANGVAPRQSARLAADGVCAVRAPDGQLLAIGTVEKGVIRLDRVI